MFAAISHLLPPWIKISGGGAGNGGYAPVPDYGNGEEDDDDNGMIEIEASSATSTTNSPPPACGGGYHDYDDDVAAATKKAVAGRPSASSSTRGLMPSPPSAKITLLALLLSTFLVYREVVHRRSASSSSSSSSSSSITAQHRDTTNVARFYDDQLVDHDHPQTTSRWKHRYYESTTYFGGPGHPILLIVGGEGATNDGILYPFVAGVLAKKFRAAVVQPEHRFYGPYPPVPYDDVTPKTLLDIFTPDQAMRDMLRLVTVHLRGAGMSLGGCSSDRNSRRYCPLITVGASYPGFLSSLFRIVHPDLVDAAYASSAPLLMYAQISENTGYYDIVTHAADATSPGCAHSVRTTLAEIERVVMSSRDVDDAARNVGVCGGDKLPTSLRRKRDLINALNLMAVYGFANYDMENYPPGTNTSMYRICRVFQDPDMDSVRTMRAYLRGQLLERWEDDNGCDMSTVVCTDEQREEYLRATYGDGDCFDMRPELDDDVVPDAYEEIYDGLKYDDMRMWDFQTCTNVIFLAGQSNTSMFLESEATYDDLAKDCSDMFGRDVVPRPTELNDRWHFAPGHDLVNVANASRILFTNGLLDMWSGGSYLEDLSPTIPVINFVEGAHHSDLTHTSLEYDEEHDTDEIRAGKERIAEILGSWIEEIRVRMVN
ncbi:hypothetical protein ACHAXA_005052 [Cyclostephanos tholiformis]|uniref:Uncharacterized protein n=1 Tax=Cyclostephanos tholiformis TaxID=382380 RepID=A0ABD3SSH8_9STRA